MTTKPCPECGERLNIAARGCSCGWKEVKGSTRSAFCRVNCQARADGDDGLCGYHRALHGNDVAAWKESQRDWRERLYADFRERHMGDTWGALIEASSDLHTVDDRRELIDVLKKQIAKGFGLPLPYNPNDSAEKIEAETSVIDEDRTEALKARARAAVEAYYARRSAA